MNNFKEQKQRILDAGYKQVSLYQGNVKKIAWNLSGRVLAKLDEIETRLPHMTGGNFVILARNSNNDKDPEQFPITTGSEKLGEAKTQIVYQEKTSDKLLENQQILNLTVQVKQLEMENDYLRKEIAELENEIAELESTTKTVLAEATPQPSLLESAKEFLGGLMEFGAPLLDQHFALQKAKLDIEREKLARRPGGAARPAQKDQNVQIRIIGEWVETFADQPEIYEALHNISAQSKSVADYMELLNQYNAELYAELSNKI
jgi:hypothetical protein